MVASRSSTRFSASVFRDAVSSSFAYAFSASRLAAASSSASLRFRRSAAERGSPSSPPVGTPSVGTPSVGTPSVAAHSPRSLESTSACSVRTLASSCATPASVGRDSSSRVSDAILASPEAIDPRRPSPISSSRATSAACAASRSPRSCFSISTTWSRSLSRSRSAAASMSISAAESELAESESAESAEADPSKPPPVLMRSRSLATSCASLCDSDRASASLIRAASASATIASRSPVSFATSSATFPSRSSKSSLCAASCRARSSAMERSRLSFCARIVSCAISISAMRLSTSAVRSRAFSSTMDLTDSFIDRSSRAASELAPLCAASLTNASSALVASRSLRSAPAPVTYSAALVVRARTSAGSGASSRSLSMEKNAVSARATRSVRRLISAPIALSSALFSASPAPSRLLALAASARSRPAVLPSLCFWEISVAASRHSSRSAANPSADHASAAALARVMASAVRECSRSSSPTFSDIPPIALSSWSSS
mmetsp:Transcript_9296/g.37637  ORF Transcript_9296/g.37637 Transcript_9296/m.37637 type:complete len:492 (+) Transcript_9296:1265-2740(+)